MHTVEHIGLGRYGDPIDAGGDKKAMDELARVLAPGGTLLFVTPIGNERIEFNAHRVYNYATIIEGFKTLKLKEFSLIPDDFEEVGYITNPSTEIINKQHWGCGCFWFTKV
jgi:SAM-dependent methyltransferase